MYTSLSLAVASRPTRSLLSLSTFRFLLVPSKWNKSPRLSRWFRVPWRLSPVRLPASTPRLFLRPSSLERSTKEESSSLESRSFTRETMLRSSLRVPFQDDGREKNEITIRKREVYTWSMLSQSSLLISLNRRFNLGARMTRNRRSGLK